MNIKKNYLENSIISGILLFLYEGMWNLMLNPILNLENNFILLLCLVTFPVTFSFGYISSYMIGKPITPQYSLKTIAINIGCFSIWSLIDICFFNPATALKNITEFKNFLNTVTSVEELIVLEALMSLAPLVMILLLLYMYMGLRLGSRLYKRLHYPNHDNIQ